MDIIDGMILFFRIYIFLVILGSLGVVVLFPIYYIIFGHKPGLIIDDFRKVYLFFTKTLPINTILIFLIISIFFIIMYIIYLIITTIIPPTSILTLFIPIRELLLKIPPLPQLQEKGVINIFDRALDIIMGSKSNKENFKNKYILNYFGLYKNNFYELIKLFNPHLNIDRFAFIIENMQNNNKASEKHNVDNDISICISNNANITTPDMSFMDLAKNSIGDMKNNVKCNLNALPTYISASE